MTIAVKKHAKIDIKDINFFCPVRFYWIRLFLYNLFGIVVLVVKILQRFDIILHIWLIYVSLEILVIISILHEMIKILREKILTAIYLY